MNRSRGNALLILALALALQGCMTTVTRTRRVPVYETRVEQVDGVELTRWVQVDTAIETYRVRRFSWKRTAVGAAFAPVVIVAHILGGLG